MNIEQKSSRAGNNHFGWHFSDSKRLSVLLQEGIESRKSSMVGTTFMWRSVRKTFEVIV